MSVQRADVLIAGASFAGLAAARALGPHALLLDRTPLGDGVTSACGAPVAIVERMGALASIRQRHDHLVIDVEGHSVTWPLPEPFCTFDYREFCRLAFEESGAAFQHASVRAIEDDRVSTTMGDLTASFIIDATGPRSRLNGALQQRRLAFGIETEIPAPVRDGLFFYFLPEVRDGYAWAFPCGPVTRFGVLSYLGKTKLRPALETFLRRFGLESGAIHGGYLATGWQPAVSRNVFIAGDAAGQCLPLTGEGIRTAVLAGDHCGRLLRAVLDGSASRDVAAARYRRFVGRERRRYRALLWGTGVALALPRPFIRVAARALSRPQPLSWFLRRYLSILRRSPAGQTV
jgi:flavin-dependent dehydrogenase